MSGCLIPRLVLAAVIGLSALGASAQDRQKSVLALYSTRPDNPVGLGMDAIVRRQLETGLNGRLDYYAEFIDFARFSDAGYQEAVRQFLRAKYKDTRFDLIVPLAETAFDFVARYRDDEIFRDVPIVFNATTPRKVVSNATGLIGRVAMKQTLDSALALHPGTERVVVVTGASAFDKLYETDAHNNFKPLEGRLAFRYLTGLAMPDLLRQVAALPPHSLVFYTRLGEDGTGEKFPPFDKLDDVSAAASVPAYMWHENGVGHGAVGGRVMSSDVMAARTAALALRVLRGERADAIPVTEVNWGVDAYDWRQLRRWGISEARVPAGSVILFRRPSGWEQYGPYIGGGILLVLVQTAFIALLLVQQKRRKGAEAALRESEERFHLMADTAPVLVWRAGVDRKCDFFNRPWLEFTGRTLAQELGDGWTEGVHPDDMAECVRVYVSSFDARQPFRMEYRLRRADGEYRWVLDSGVPRYGRDEQFAGFIGSCIDITERKAAEHAVAEGQRRYALAIEAAPAGMMMVDRAGTLVMVNSQIETLFGYRREELIGQPVEMLVPVRFRHGHGGHRRGFHGKPEARLIGGGRDLYGVRKDGVEIPIEIGLNPFSTAEGDFVLGSVADITERRAAENENDELMAQLQRVTGRLIEAQESERSRIARDLHDDVSQQIAGLAIALSSLKRRLTMGMDGGLLRADVAALQERTTAMAENIRHLSHDLHPSVLQHAGLVAALSAHCAEIQRQQKVGLTFTAEGDFERTGRAAGLCLYRVAQEALRNVVTHALARHATVHLLRVGDTAELTIADDGQGFDIAQARGRKEGLGLVSISERVRLVGGTVSIVTEPNKGTRVSVRVPMSAHVHAGATLQIP